MIMAKFVLPHALGRGGGDVGLVAGGIFDAKDEHVLGHPTFVAAHDAGDAQREALFAEKGIPAVAGTVADDEALVGKNA